jgi:hypothetical protein
MVVEVLDSLKNPTLVGFCFVFELMLINHKIITGTSMYEKKPRLFWGNVSTLNKCTI